MQFSRYIWLWLQAILPIWEVLAHLQSVIWYNQIYNYSLVFDYIKSLVEVFNLLVIFKLFCYFILISHLVVTLIQLLPFELRSHSKSIVWINEVLSHCVRKNDLNSKFILRLRLVFIKNLMSGSHLLSHTVSSAVPSAAQALTFVFGMRTGVTPGRIATRRILAFHLATFDPN